jgi:aminopeptidase N
MTDFATKTIRREDYAPPDFLVDEVALFFELDADRTLVRAQLRMRRNLKGACRSSSLFLDGTDLSLQSLRLDGTAVPTADYRLDDCGLTLLRVPDAFDLETEVIIRPVDNTVLEGLYRSGSMLCTQCEAEGFRRITFFPDRPDVLSRFTTTLVADPQRYPVLLSNGNLIDRTELADGRLKVTWRDPFPKPCYLFALVAGDLFCREDAFTTASGRCIDLRLYVEHHNRDKCDHALHALKQAMHWDEDTYGLECDLDTYMIVAVDDFNMGAMENKGLNIFNARYVLADAATATDTDFQAVEEVVAHEYFHNWTGNRVTCRDWFQLSLKEGLTVFRDQEFSADRVSRSLKRIRDVRHLRACQFVEDSGPLAHPVRPDAYQEINNFYTSTVYEKGAEIVRMLCRLLGWPKFRAGMDRYLTRHDGQAVTIEDFLLAMEEAGQIDLTQFRLWYGQAGTPRVQAIGRYDVTKREYILEMTQTCPPASGQPPKNPLPIPVAMALLDAEGRELPLNLVGEADRASAPQRVFLLERERQVFRFEHIPERPVPSLLRGFSAPVRLHFDYRDKDLTFLMAHDSDPFIRWDAAQQLGIRTILGLVNAFRSGRPLQVNPCLLEGFRAVLQRAGEDWGLTAEMLALPSEAFLADQMEVIDVDGIGLARDTVRRTLALELKNLWQNVWQRCCEGEGGAYRATPAETGRRSLKNLCLGYLMEWPEEALLDLVVDCFAQADNMTDRLAALALLADHDDPRRSRALQLFFQQAGGEALVIDKWFAVQAAARLPGALQRVTALQRHPDFNIRNPNRVRALIGTFVRCNRRGFHVADGSGYGFLADNILVLDRINPQVAAGLAGAFSSWRRHDRKRRELMTQQLRRIAGQANLSRDVRDIVDRCLQGHEAK